MPAPFTLDRIDGTTALPAPRPENASVRGDEAMIEMALSDDHEIELYFPAPGGEVRIEWLSPAGDVLAHLKEMDNDAQRVSAQQWAGSPYPSSYFDRAIRRRVRRGSFSQQAAENSSWVAEAPSYPLGDDSKRRWFSSKSAASSAALRS